MNAVPSLGLLTALLPPGRRSCPARQGNALWGYLWAKSREESRGKEVKPGKNAREVGWGCWRDF